MYKIIHLATAEEVYLPAGYSFKNLEELLQNDRWSFVLTDKKLLLSDRPPEPLDDKIYLYKAIPKHQFEIIEFPDV